MCNVGSLEYVQAQRQLLEAVAAVLWGPGEGRAVCVCGAGGGVPSAEPLGSFRGAAFCSTAWTCASSRGSSSVSGNAEASNGVAAGVGPDVVDAGAGVVSGNAGNGVDGSGAQASVRGKRYLKNKRKRERKAGRSKAKVFLNGDPAVHSVSLVDKWRAENELAVVRARREIEVLGLTDVTDEVRKRRAETVVRTERALAAVEKVHASLVGSGVSGSISPDSSASAAAVHAVVVERDKLSARVDELESRLLSAGLDPATGDAKNTWTCGSDGEPVEHETVDRLTGGAYYPGRSGDKHVIRVRQPCDGEYGRVYYPGG